MRETECFSMYSDISSRIMDFSVVKQKLREGTRKFCFCRRPWAPE